MLKRKKREAGSLQITSLLDAMTILLLFLLKNLSTEGVILTNADNLVLPLSESQKAPKSLSKQVVITATKILFDNKPVSVVKDIRQDTIKTIKYQIKGLDVALKNEAEMETQMVQTGAMKKEDQGNIIIQADKNTEYDILYKTILTCGSNFFVNIKLAVMQRHQG